MSEGRPHHYWVGRGRQADLAGLGIGKRSRRNIITGKNCCRIEFRSQLGRPDDLAYTHIYLVLQANTLRRLMYGRKDDYRFAAAVGCDEASGCYPWARGQRRARARKAQK
jgi:hypothetical protein